MSGTPKYSNYELQRRQREELEERRRQAAAEEERRRRESQEQARLARLNDRLQHVNRSLIQLSQDVATAAVSSTDRNLLNGEVERIRSLLTQVRKIDEADRGAGAISSLRGQLQDASRRFEEAETRRKALELQERLERARARHAAAVEKAAAEKWASQSTAAAIARSRAMRTEADIDAADQAVGQCVREATAAEAAWQARRAKIRESLSSTQAELVSMQSDDVIVRWHAPRLDLAHDQFQDLNTLFEKNHFDAVEQGCTELRQSFNEWIKIAQEEQLKNDRRDYVLQSLSESLRELGYVVKGVSEETPGHPKSALYLLAANAGNQSISARVPIEGPLEYEVGGFQITSDVRIDGVATNCDAAETQLEQMHSIMAEAHGVDTGEIWWDTKNPNRDLSTANPRRDGSVRGLK